MRKKIEIEHERVGPLYEWGQSMRWTWQELEIAPNKRTHYRKLVALLKENTSHKSYGAVIDELHKALEEAAQIRLNRMISEKNFWPWMKDKVICTEVEVDGQLWPVPLPVLHDFMAELGKIWRAKRDRKTIGDEEKSDTAGTERLQRRSKIGDRKKPIKATSSRTRRKHGDNISLSLFDGEDAKPTGTSK